MYKFCIGENVQQLHIEANGTISEEFLLGKMNMSLATKVIDEEVIDDLAT